MMFEVEQVLNWNEVEKYRGQHEILKEFFVDKDAKSYAMVGNGKFVITRDYHPNSDSVTFSIFERTAFIIGNHKFLKENGEIDKYWQNKNSKN